MRPLHLTVRVCSVAAMMAALVIPLGCSVEASRGDTVRGEVSDGDAKAMLETVFMITQLAHEIEAFRMEEGTLPPGDDAATVAKEIAFIDDLMMDGWKRPLHYEPSADGKSYTIVSFGSDGAPQRTTWSTPAESTDPAADVVFSNGRFVRSPRQFALDRMGVGTEEKLTKFVEQALERSMAKRTLDEMQRWGTTIHASLLEAPRRPEQSIDDLLTEVERASYFAPARTDAWGTPFVFDIDGRHYRIVSAGSDREFEEPGAGKMAIDSYSSDAIYSDGEFTHRWPGAGELSEILEYLLAEEMGMASLPSASPERLEEIKVRRIQRHIYRAAREERTADGVQLYLEAMQIDPSFSNGFVLQQLIEPVDATDRELVERVRMLAEREGIPLPPQLQ
jgi:hypothetical protein